MEKNESSFTELMRSRDYQACAILILLLYLFDTGSHGTQGMISDSLII